MKGFLVINRSLNVYFIDSDREFANHINNQAKEAGLTHDDELESDTIPINIVMQLFSPLFMSQWFLIDHKKNPCQSITCDNNFLFIFKQYEDLLLIAINGDGSESEEFLQRKVSVFVRIMEFLFGPVTNEIGYSKFGSRKEKWIFLREILQTWDELINNEQSFLVEAIERLHVNQAVNVQCMEILEAAINRIRKAGEKYTHHALLLVNNKLLSLYSDRNAMELNAADTMSIILLVKQMFPTSEKLEDFFAFSYRKSDNEATEVRSPASVRTFVPEKYESALEGDDEDSMDDLEENYLSATETPSKQSVKTSLNSGNPYPQVSEQTVEEVYNPQTEEFYTPTEDMLNHKGDLETRRRSRTSEDVHSNQSWVKNLFGSGKARSKSFDSHTSQAVSSDMKPESSTPTSNSGSMKSLEKELPEQPPQQVEVDDSYVHRTVFLCTELCQFSPHHIHCLQIYPGMVLVLISEVPLGSHANKLCQLLYLFKDLLMGKKTKMHRAQGQELYEVINSLLAKLTPAILRTKGMLTKVYSEIKNKWDNQDFKLSLLEYLEQSSNTEISPSVERALNALLKRIKELFLCMYLGPRPLSARISDTIKEIRDKAKLKLRDYKDYLSVKAQRNITMTTYLDMFPGLVHFIYVDRKINQVMAPSLNITQNGSCQDHDATQLMKEKIWKMTEWVQLNLRKGISMLTARDGDYHFSYFLWFEDCNGSQMPVQNPFVITGPLPPPGIVSGNFYRSLTRASFPNVVPGSVNCYELIMMHVGLVHTQYVVDHCQKLTRMMWEISGDPYSPMSLVW